MTLFEKLAENRFWRSLVRHGLRPTNRNRVMLVMDNVFLHLHPAKVRRRNLEFSSTYFLGGIAIVLFVVLVATGLLLMLYYHPSVPQAYDDMKELRFVVSNGVFLRNLHRWAAHAMVIVVFFHLLRVFFHRAFRPPREFNWVVGILLFLFTLLLSYTGYLLPWDQLAFWGVSVGTNMVKAMPLLGAKIRFLLLGGHIVGPNALLRFYVLHCVLLPLLLTAGLAVHLWRVRKDGGVAGSASRRRARVEKSEEVAS
jgi:quinol-cytochrome oxidoreductase complex cytochrome b subunit